MQLAQRNNYCLRSKEYNIQSYFEAYQNIVKIHLNTFLQKVYQEGLFKIVKNSGCVKMKGYFGSVVMSSCLEYNEVSLLLENTKSQNCIMFVSEKLEPLGLYFRVHKCTCDIKESIDILDEVIALWPQDYYQQMNVFQGSYNFSF